MDQTEEERQIVQKKVDELRSSRFKQMDLPAWRPKQSFLQTSIIFFVFGSIFLGLGIILFYKSNEVVETVYRYDDQCEPVGTD